MSNAIQTFNFESQSITTAVINGEIFFHATELARVLGFGNPRQAIASHIDKEDVQKLDTTSKARKTQQVTFTNESGMYALIFGSTKDEAKRFKRWVTSEVLPTIRKTGQYRHTITPAQAYQIQKAVKVKCQHNSVHYQTIYHALYDKFAVSSYKDILASDFKTAMAFIAGFELSVITSNAHISSDIIVHLSEQFFKTSNLIQQVRSEYLPFLENVNSNKDSELNSRLTLLQYDIQGNIRDLFQLLPSDVQNNKQHPITKKLEMAYYCDDMRYLIHGG